MNDLAPAPTGRLDRKQQERYNSVELELGLSVRGVLLFRRVPVRRHAQHCAKVKGRDMSEPDLTGDEK